MSARHPPARPLRSVQEIVKEAQDFDHSLTSSYPLSIILRTAQNILNQATNYERDGDLEQTYLFLYRHAEFCMARVATHPDRKLSQHKQAVSRVTKQVATDLERLEQLRPILNAQYEADRVARRGSTTDGPADGVRPNEKVNKLVVNDAGDRSQIALQLARRRYRGSRVRNDAELSSLFHNLNMEARGSARDSLRNESEPSQGSAYAYPNVSQSTYQTAPPVPSKLEYDPIEDARQLRSQAPRLPAKFTHAPALPEKTHIDDVAQIDHAQTITFQPLASSESGKPLRSVFLPTELQASFLTAARPNTSLNLETCGVLCATLISGALFISHVVIPDQIATSDTCDTTDTGDAKLFDYVDARSLLVCGWIHTHPTQTCFLSSRDLHTSVGYQVMLDESIAIVCAPSQTPSYGVFRITDPPGLGVVSRCTAKGLFHPHDQGGLYTDATRPGHVTELKGLDFEVVDLRDKT